MIYESFQEELTRVRHEMDDAEDQAERACLRKKWLKLREAEGKRQPKKVQTLEGLCSPAQIVEAYGGFDAMYEAYVAENRRREIPAA